MWWTVVIIIQLPLYALLHMHHLVCFYILAHLFLPVLIHALVIMATVYGNLKGATQPAELYRYFWIYLLTPTNYCNTTAYYNNWTWNCNWWWSIKLVNWILKSPLQSKPPPPQDILTSCRPAQRAPLSRCLGGSLCKYFIILHLHHHCYHLHLHHHHNQSGERETLYWWGEERLRHIQTLLLPNSEKTYQCKSTKYYMYVHHPHEHKHPHNHHHHHQTRINGMSNLNDDVNDEDNVMNGTMLSSAVFDNNRCIAGVYANEDDSS